MIKKTLLFFVFISLIHAPLSAQPDTELQEIQKIIEKFERGFADRDLDSMAAQLSKNYLYRREKGDIVDYTAKISLIEKNTNRFFKKNTDYSFWGLKLIKSDITDNKAIVSVDFKCKALNLYTVKKVRYHKVKLFYLAKENGEWKITKIENIAKRSGRNK